MQIRNGMSNQEILVARHGQTDWNKNFRWQGLSDIPLNAAGIEQARELGNLLRDEGITRIYSSDLTRARKTAEIVSEILRIDSVQTDDRLRERYLGKFEGWLSRDVARYAGISEDRYKVLETDELQIDGLPEVELWRDFAERIWNTFSDISSKSAGDKSLIVAHGGVLRAISYHLTDGADDFPDFKNCQVLRLVKCGSGWDMK